MRLTAVLTGLGMLVTVAGLALLVSGPITYTSSSDGHASLAFVWTTWPTVAVCAAITVGLGILAIRLRTASKPAD